MSSIKPYIIFNSKKKTLLPKEYINFDPQLEK